MWFVRLQLVLPLRVHLSNWLGPTGQSDGRTNRPVTFAYKLSVADANDHSPSEFIRRHTHTHTDKLGSALVTVRALFTLRTFRCHNLMQLIN